MSTKPEPLELNAAVDGELELARQLAVEASDDPAVRAQLADLRALRDSVGAVVPGEVMPRAADERREAADERSLRRH